MKIFLPHSLSLSLSRSFAGLEGKAKNKKITHNVHIYHDLCKKILKSLDMGDEKLNKRIAIRITRILL
jgi:hypothetical protein